jgi:AraC family transcriptional regulator
MNSSKLNMNLVGQVLQLSLPDQRPSLVGKDNDSRLFLADYQKYAGAQIPEHTCPFHTVEIMGTNSVSKQKRRMGDYTTDEPFQGGEVGFCPSQANYSLIWDQEVDFTLIALDPDITEEIAEAKFGSSQFELIPQLLVADIYPIKEIVNIIKQEMALGYPNGNLFLENMRNALVIALLNKFAIFNKPVTANNINDELSNKKIKLIQDYVKEHLTENINLVELAKIVGISECHVSRSFKQATGINISEYIISERIKLAQKLLTSTSFNIAEIACACGFHDASHFNRHFKLLMQTTPTVFRKNFT